MQTSRQETPFLKQVISLLMTLLLLWLTVCTPYVYRYQQLSKEQVSSFQALEENADEDNAPLSNTNEEKAETGPTFAQEFLHEAHPIDHPFTLAIRTFGYFAQDDFVAFHPEFITPPPDFRAA